MVLIEITVMDDVIELECEIEHPCSLHDNVACALMKGSETDDKLNELIQTPGAATKYFRAEGYRQDGHGALADAFDGFRIVPYTEEEALAKLERTSGKSMRKRKEEGCSTTQVSTSSKIQRHDEPIDETNGQSV